MLAFRSACDVPKPSQSDAGGARGFRAIPLADRSRQQDPVIGYGNAREPNCAGHRRPGQRRSRYLIASADPEAGRSLLVEARPCRRAYRRADRRVRGARRRRQSRVDLLRRLVLRRMFLIAVLGGLVFVTLGDWSLFTVRETFRSPDPFRRVAYRLLLVAPLFAMLTGYSRIGGELESASSSRYVYVIAIA